VIKTQNLGKSFGSFAAVADVNLSVDGGELLALLGPNGAGKTTTLRMLASLLRPTTGSAWVAGWNVVEHPTQVRRQLGLLTEHPGVYLRMTAIDYLEFFGQLHGMEDSAIRARALGLMARLDMAGAAGRRIGEYSKGMRQKLAIIRAMLHDPPVLMLDEPTSAMDPLSARQVRDTIRQSRDNRRTILICTHNLAEAEALADRIAIIRRGRIIAEGALAELKHHLLGDPLMEVRLLQSLDGHRPDLDGVVSIEASGDQWLRYRTTDPEATNPLVLRRLTALGLTLVTLSEVQQSLEEVYLRAVDNSGEEMQP
jgi:ABC-2 type transport system ATP-binding protein